jgi:hypothetical protein
VDTHNGVSPTVKKVYAVDDVGHYEQVLPETHVAQPVKQV